MATPSSTNVVDDLSPSLRHILTPDQAKQLSQSPRDAEALSIEYSIATSFTDKGNYEAAEELLRRNLSARQNALGTTHPDTLATMHHLGTAQTQLGHFDDAEATYRELIPLYEKPAASMAARSNLGWTLNQAGKYAAAEDVLRGLLPELRERFAEDDPRVLGCLRHLMEAVGGQGQGRVDEALEMNRAGMALVAKMNGGDQLDELEAMKEMGARLEEWKSKG